MALLGLPTFSAAGPRIGRAMLGPWDRLQRLNQGKYTLFIDRSYAYCLSEHAS